MTVWPEMTYSLMCHMKKVQSEFSIQMGWNDFHTNYLMAPASI